jgi:peroxiredoxin
MRPFPAVVIAATVVSAAAGIGFYHVESQIAPSAPPDVGETVTARVTPPAEAMPAPARPAPSLALTEAIKALDLVKPARVKLADDFSVRMPDGGTFRLSEQRGRVVMVNFWATWCPPCLEEMPAMERLYRQHKDHGFTLVAISVDTNPALVTPFVRAHRLSFPIGLDPGMDLANTYAVRALPSSFMVDRDGNLAALALGPRRWDGAAAHALVAALAR